MSNWISITIETLYEARVAALIDACSSAAKAAGQADRAAGLIQGVVNDVRMAVMSCSANRVDDDETTVPNSLRDLTVDLVIARLKKAIEDQLTEDERKDIERHDRRLRLIASCQWKVEQPDTPIAPPVEAGTEIETIVEGNQGNSREDLAGL